VTARTLIVLVSKGVHHACVSLSPDILLRGWVSMMGGVNFTAAIAALHNAGDDADLCEPFLSALPVAGSAISTLGNPFGVETVCASDVAAARLDEIQLDLGEGPCWQALRTGEPVLEPNVARATSARWPVALRAMQETGLGAVFAFPMRLGSFDVGVVDLYTNDSGTLAPQPLQDAMALTEAAARQVLRRALLHAESDPDGALDPDPGPYSRREVHQASGMLIAQTGAGAEDALLILRGHTFAAGRSVRDLASDVIARRIDFTDNPGTAPSGGSSHDPNS
jgi:hypothetical protein